MYKKFALIVLLVAPVLATLVDNMVPKPIPAGRSVESTTNEASGDKTGFTAPPPVTSAATQPGMAPPNAGLPTLDPAGIEPTPMMAAAPMSAPSPIAGPPVMATVAPPPPPPPGLAQSNDDGQ